MASKTLSGVAKTMSMKVQGRRGAGSSTSRSGRLETLKRKEPQESTELITRLTPGRRETDSDEVPDPEGGRRGAAQPTDSEGAARRFANAVSSASAEHRGSKSRGDNAKRVASAERRDDFVRREKL
jgi:hypothetical protein